MTRVLMVCVGNVCRSPLAERLLATSPVSIGGGVSVASAGVDALVGDPMDAQAAGELARLGGSAEGFGARQLTPALVAEADLVLAATKDVRARVLGIAPAGMRRTFTLLEFAALCAEPEVQAASTSAELVAMAARRRSRVAHDDLDVRDPFRLDDAVHRQVADQVQAAVSTIAQRLAQLTG